MIRDAYFEWMVTTVIAAPAASFFALAAPWLFGREPSEALARSIVKLGNVASLIAAVAVGGALAAGVPVPDDVELGTWFGTGDYEFVVGVHVDAVSATMMVLVAFVTGLIGHFSTRYLHGQKGFVRFFLLLALFATGMQLLVSAASIDQLFLGWELVGLTSALLVAYFQERRAPVEGGLRVFVTYRLCDLGLLIGAVLLHQTSGTSDLARAPEAMRAHAGTATTLVPLLLLLAAMGKSAQFPFGAWLPRAMEGPTPSSALFYGALSVHAGVYLLVRAQPLFAASAAATIALGAVGAVTALHATLVGRVQTDAKSALAYATMTQVGVMLVEIALGATTLALVHLVSHALLRCFQMLRVPSTLRDARAAAIAAVRERGAFARRLPGPLAAWLYRLSLERFGLEAIFDRAFVAPIFALGNALDRAERRWMALLAGIERPGAPPAGPAQAPAEARVMGKR